MSREMDPEFSYQNYFHIDSVVMAMYGGIWPKNRTGFSRHLHRIIWIIINILIPFLFAILEMLNILVHFNNLKVFLDIFHIAMNVVLTGVKLYFIIAKRYDFDELFTIIFTDPAFMPKNKEEQDMAAEVFKILPVLRQVFPILCCFAITAAYLSDIEKNQYLPFTCWYPFDVTVSPNFEIACVHQLLSVYYLVGVLVIVEIVLMDVTSFVALQSDFICHRLENFSLDENSLIDVIKVHKKVVK